MQEKLTKEDSEAFEKDIANVINELEVTDSVTGDCQIKLYQKTRKRKLGEAKTNTIRQTKQKRKIEMTDEMKSNLGIKGERYIYKCLQNKKKELLKGIGLDDYKSIIFYNIDYDDSKTDQSVGKGCDIEIITKDNTHVYLEIKTSLDSTEYYTMTYNEYKKNIEQKDNYYVVKISNFKYLNKNENKILITIIRNPYKILCENTDMLKEITLYTKY